MRTNFGSRIAAAVMAASILIAPLGVTTIYGRATKFNEYDEAKKEAAKKVAAADKLAKDCNELKEKAAAAKAAAEAAKKKAEDLRKAAGAADKEVEKEETTYTDTGSTRTGKAEDEADYAAEAANKAADDAQDRARRNPNDKAAQKDAKDKEAAAKAKEKAADEADAKAADGYYGSGTTKARKAARDAERAARKAERDAEAAAEAAAAAQALVEATEPCGRVDAARADADAAIARFERLLGEKIKRTGGSSETNGDTALIDGWKKTIHPQQNTAQEPGKPGIFVPPATGLQTITFDTLQGVVTVNLPDDMRAGDTISGTVVAEPKGGTPEERTANAAKLKDMVVAFMPFDPIQTKQLPIAIFDLANGVPAGGVATSVAGTFTVLAKANVGLFSVPTGNPAIHACSRSGSTVAINESCNPLYQVVFTPPVQPAGTVNTPVRDFTIPSVGQVGKPIVITGRFDGNSSNTNISIRHDPSSEGGPPLSVMAESQGKVIVKIANNLVGPLKLTVNEGGRESTGNFRNVGVSLEGKTNLMKAEKTELKIQFSGLSGITTPLPVTLNCNGVISVAGGMIQQIVIQPSQVNADGTFKTTRVITGVQAGGWTASVIVNRP